MLLYHLVAFLSLSPLPQTLCIFTKVLELGQGKVRGLRSISGVNRYYGIPYATSTRFQPPKTPPKWRGTFNAVRRYATCSQIVAPIILGTEDCHQLDIFTPENTSSASRLPVMIFLHGGAYYYGSKAHYDPEFLVTKRIVSVIINYRVGVLGFLCLEDIANLGLKDQVAALKWIQDNIKAFGGDPDNVTIFGQSAGASCAAMHMLSPQSAGLFHKLILFSGSPFAPWAFNPDNKIPTYEDARKLGNPLTDRNVIEIFEKASVTDLLKATQDTSRNSRYFKYSPCVESNKTNPFFPDTPYNIITSGKFNKVPIIIGFTDVEGQLFYGLHNDETFEEFDENFVEKLPSVFSYCSDEDRKNLSSEMRKKYFGAGVINSSQVTGVVDYYSDWIAYSSVDAFSELMVRASNLPVFNHMFSYEGDRNFAKMIFGWRTNMAGASHSDDIFYVFKPAGLSLLLTNEDKLFIDRFTTMLANFMRFGNPTPYQTRLLPVLWPPRQINSSLLQLSHKMVVRTMPDSHKGTYWLRVLCDYGLAGYVPCASKEMCSRSTRTSGSASPFLEPRRA